VRQKAMIEERETMGLTSIEYLLFEGQNCVHEIIALRIEQATLTLAVKPQSQLHPPFTVQFHQVELLHEEVLDEDTAFPWEIIGFDAHHLGSGRWKFHLLCLEKELLWNSSWVRIVSTSIEHLVFQGQNLIHEVILLTIEQATLTLMVAPQPQ
jgi:hypothetical protein